MKINKVPIKMILVSGLFFILCSLALAQSLRTKLDHLYITIGKIEVSKDGGTTWLTAFEGNQVLDLVAISGENVLIFKPRANLLKEATYNKARTIVTYAKAEITIDDGIHGPKQLIFTDPAVIKKSYPIIDERSIKVKIIIENGYVPPSAAFNFDAEKSYSIKADWDPKINNYKVIDIKFDPLIKVK